MALPIIAPAATPPMIPAPTAQPQQPAFAGAGAATAAKPNAAAAARPTSDLCMCFPHVIGRVPIWDVDRRKSPKPPEFATNPPKLKSHSLAEVRCRKSPPFASERRSITETPQLFSSAWLMPLALDAGANPSVAVPYLAPHAGRRIGIRCVIAVVAVWIVVRRCQCAADGGPKRKAAEAPSRRAMLAQATNLPAQRRRGWRQ